MYAFLNSFLHVWPILRLKKHSVYFLFSFLVFCPEVEIASRFHFRTMKRHNVTASLRPGSESNGC